MSQIRKHLLICIAALGLGVGGLSAHADQPTSDGKTGRPDAMYGHGKFDRHSMEERFAKRQAELHDKLKLSAGQESAWNTFVEKMKPGTLPARPDKAEIAKLTAPERMERMHAMMKEREQKMGERVAATKQFYAVLTPEQRKIFDEQFQRSHGPGRGHRSGRK